MVVQIMIKLQTMCFDKYTQQSTNNTQYYESEVANFITFFHKVGFKWHCVISFELTVNYYHDLTQAI